jgi:hypothetical protein
MNLKGFGKKRRRPHLRAILAFVWVTEKNHKKLGIADRQARDLNPKAPE